MKLFYETMETSRQSGGSLRPSDLKALLLSLLASVRQSVETGQTPTVVAPQDEPTVRSEVGVPPRLGGRLSSSGSFSGTWLQRAQGKRLNGSADEWIQTLEKMEKEVKNGCSADSFRRPDICFDVLKHPLSESD